MSNLIRYVRRRLGWKLFVSHFIVVLVGMVVLVSAMEYSMPNAFEHHMAAMAAAMQADSPALAKDLFTNFHRAVNESLAFSLPAAFLVAIVVSTLVSRQIVKPVRCIMITSRRIAEGHYSDRVGLPQLHNQDNLDELGHLAISFNQMAARLEQIETTRRQLIGDVAHELRTPLTTIKGYLEGLMDNVVPADASTFERMYHEAERLQRLVHDLQELSRVEGGAIEMRPQPITVAQLVNTAVARLNYQFKEKEVELATEVSENLPAVRADEGRIGQVLLNLLGNALQYTPSGGRVLISARQCGAEIQIKVSDSGIGISAEHLPLIFTHFYRVDRSRSRTGGGTGVGLTIARHLVEAHGGRIWAESAGPGMGSTFTFTLPVASL